MKKITFLFLVFIMAVLGMASAETPTNAQADPPTVALLPAIFALGDAPAFETTIFATGQDTTHTDIVASADGRTFLVGKKGAITLLEPDGTVWPTPFLDLTNQVISNAFERGLYTLALHPDFENNRTFYVSYLRNGDKPDHTYLVISQFTHPAETPNQADPASEKVLFEIKKTAEIHHAGALAFGPDGYLYITVGDDSNLANAQDGNTLLGKLLRIDVDPITGTYTIPESNPFVDDKAVRDEIWALGLRNPWRLTFDPDTHAGYLVDVGQGRWEEVNLLPAGHSGGLNFGWPCLEAGDIYLASACQESADYTPPIHAYAHENGRCSITGGVVYQGNDFPAWTGRYLFGDFCSGEIFILDRTGENEWQSIKQGKIDWTVSAIGPDPEGEVLIGGFNTRQIRKLVPFGQAGQ